MPYTTDYWRSYVQRTREARWVGILGDANMRCRILSIAQTGIRVRWRDGRMERVNPADLRPLR